LTHGMVILSFGWQQRAIIAKCPLMKKASDIFCARALIAGNRPNPYSKST
jgi:hypothetical protein